MRTFMPGQVRTWLSTATDTHGLLSYARAAGIVASALLLQWILGRLVDEPQFWLFHVAIALAAASVGAAAMGVATLLFVLWVRLSSAVPLSTALLFGLEGLLIGLVVLRLTKAIRGLQRNLDVSTRAIRELESAARQAVRIDGALSRLDEASEDTVLILLDPTGLITDWRSGARRVYGYEGREVVGTAAAVLFDETGREEFPRLLAEARRATTRRSCRQERAGGAVFEAEIEISPLSPGGRDGFTMIAFDLTHQQARAAADYSTAAAQVQLQGEMALAQRQLSTLRDLTDPTLNVLGTVQFVAELLDRLRRAIHAEGIALIDVDRDPRRLFCASGELQCQEVHHRPVAAVNTDVARTVMIHNDAAGVAEVSAAVWPDDVSSLIAVSVVRAGSPRAIMEVVNRTGRRATEWEIALVQVVAARIAGSLEDGLWGNSVARAGIPESSSNPVPLSESALRLTLDAPVAGDHRIAT
jgi:PAS domain S-box-containing protein